MNTVISLKNPLCYLLEFRNSTPRSAGNSATPSVRRRPETSTSASSMRRPGPQPESARRSRPAAQTEPARADRSATAVRCWVQNVLRPSPRRRSMRRPTSGDGAFHARNGADRILPRRRTDRHGRRRGCRDGWGSGRGGRSGAHVSARRRPRNARPADLDAARASDPGGRMRRTDAADRRTLHRDGDGRGRGHRDGRKLPQRARRGCTCFVSTCAISRARSV